MEIRQNAILADLLIRFLINDDVNPLYYYISHEKMSNVDHLTVLSGRA